MGVCPFRDLASNYVVFFKQAKIMFTTSILHDWFLPDESTEAKHLHLNSAAKHLDLFTSGKVSFHIVLYQATNMSQCLVLVYTATKLLHIMVT